MTETTEGVATPTPLPTFYVTFGMMYRDETHPYWPSAHPDGWLEVMAPDEEAARLLLRECIGTRYAFIYDAARFNEDGGDARRWYPMGMIARISTGDEPWVVSRSAHHGHAEVPRRQFTASDCRYYGVETNEVVAARIEGVLDEGSDEDAIEQLGYEAELVHKHCLTEGLAMFRKVFEVDSRVLAGELDYNDPHECPVCETSIT